MKFKVNAIKTDYLVAVIDAKNLQEAEEIANNELMTMDFDCQNTEFTLEEIVEAKDYKTYIVQYEVEFHDSLSVNNVVDIIAQSEYDAMDRFNNNDDLKNYILNNHPGSMCVTANAAWDE